MAAFVQETIQWFLMRSLGKVFTLLLVAESVYKNASETETMDL